MGFEDEIDKALSHGQDLFNKLEPSLLPEHIGKWVVIRRDTAEYFIYETESDAEMAALNIMQSFPDGSNLQVMGALWFQIGARPTQYRQPPN